MATPKELVIKISEITGVSEETLTVYDRNLSIAGLRSKNGRGRSAAKITAQDAAHLLIAASAIATRAVNSADVVRDHINMISLPYVPDIPRVLGEPANTVPYKILLKDKGLEEFCTLPEQHSFPEAVTTLIAMAQNDRFSFVSEMIPITNKDNQIHLFSGYCYFPAHKTRVVIGIKLTEPPSRAEITFQDLSTYDSKTGLCTSTKISYQQDKLDFSSPSKVFLKRTNELEMPLITVLGDLLKESPQQ